MKRILVLYVPVLHAGYLKLFEKYRGKVDALFLLGEDIVADFFSFKREIRALDSSMMQSIIGSLDIFPIVETLGKNGADALKGAEIITADEDMGEKIIERYFPENKVIYESVFLRWDSKNLKSAGDIKYDRVSTDLFDREMCGMAANEAEKSSDWWRHVGAIVTKNRKVIFKNHNHHIPSDHTPYANGDPRDVIEAGTLNLIYTSLHAEQSIIAEAAQQGISLEGTSMYLNIFPCPLCAKLMAEAGIKKCYFKTGSAWLDAESVLRTNGAEVILVK